MEKSIAYDRFAKMVDKKLKNKSRWMPEEEIQNAANIALHLFTDRNYSCEENAVSDVLAAMPAVNDFNLKVLFSEGRLTVDYCDGSDQEVHQIKSIDEILSVVQEAVESLINETDVQKSKESAWLQTRG